MKPPLEVFKLNNTFIVAACEFRVFHDDAEIIAFRDCFCAEVPQKSSREEKFPCKMASFSRKYIVSGKLHARSGKSPRAGGLSSENFPLLCPW